MKAKCPENPNHQEFITTAHVAQTWKVDQHGNFVAEISNDCVVADPHPHNQWTCATCGATATVDE